ncbi:MAG: nucleotide sugar dehydrogenase [Chloroflexota bacterium]
MTLDGKIMDGSATIAIIGLGYVGLPLATELADLGYRVVGIDVDQGKIASIRRGESYLRDIPSERLSPLVQVGLLSATTDYDVLKATDVAFICVPTPYTAAKVPDISYIRAAAQGIAGRLRPEMLIILQSTTYPGTTQECVLPILATSGLRAGQDFHLAFSPERVDPGNRLYTVKNTPKVVGGLTPRCAELAALLLSRITPEVKIVSSPRVAEMTKLLENVFRSVNIALVNELALLAERMGMDIWEVIEAASTKPFGFMPFYPGPGVGGHCIPVDPFYLSWKAREYDFSTRFIELAAQVNQDMPYHVRDLVARALNSRGKTIRGARVLVLGIAFKKDVDDARNSPAQRVIELLLELDARVSYHDSYVERFNVGGNAFYAGGLALEATPLTAENLRGQDCVVVLAAHSAYDFRWIVENSSLVVDTVNATRGLPHREKIVRLGAPKG